ncbi:hypothetical protein [Clostridium tyrobutyricum]|uniref:hypothetical protein n=1 Tax=Clostridium tyrobutyricum TaxID=1519 RepID=UPI00073D9368|nr:hypothetical protein [Clostridium tyrobutyricum]
MKIPLFTRFCEENGIDDRQDYQTMKKIFWERKGILCGKITAHKYMNKELALRYTARRKKSGYIKEHSYKIFIQIE